MEVQTKIVIMVLFTLTMGQAKEDLDIMKEMMHDDFTDVALFCEDGQSHFEHLGSLRPGQTQRRVTPHTRDIMKETLLRHTPELWPEWPEFGFQTREDTSHNTCHIDISHQHVKILNLVYYKCRGKTVKSIAK